MHIQSHAQPIKKKGTNKLILGFAAVVASAVVGTTGLVAATGMGHQDKPSKGQCAAAGFKNYGQCVKEWAHHKNHPGGGYGGHHDNDDDEGEGSGRVEARAVNHHNSASADVSLELNNSNNNVITIILNFFRS